MRSVLDVSSLGRNRCYRNSFVDNPLFDYPDKAVGNFATFAATFHCEEGLATIQRTDVAIYGHGQRGHRPATRVALVVGHSLSHFGLDVFQVSLQYFLNVSHIILYASY